MSRGSYHLGQHGYLLRCITLCRVIIVCSFTTYIFSTLENTHEAPVHEHIRMCGRHRRDRRPPAGNRAIDA